LFGIPTASFIAVLALRLGDRLALQERSAISRRRHAVGVSTVSRRRCGRGRRDRWRRPGHRVFTTTLHTPDNVEIRSPTAACSARRSRTTTPTRPGARHDSQRGTRRRLGVALETLRGCSCRQNAVLADPAPAVAIAEVGSGAVSIVVRPWCKKEDYWDLRSISSAR